MDYKLKPRQKASAELNSNILDAVFGSIQKANNHPFATCLTCISFDEEKSYCKQHKSNPPPRVIVYSCPDYFGEEEIPF
jgi:hypothetical protein